LERSNDFSIFAADIGAITGANNASGRSMRDILRDWRRWSAAERLIALLLIMVLTLVPTAVALNMTAAVSSHHTAETRSP
jgi:hypothetical protein